MNDWFEWNGTRCTAYGIHVTDQPEIVRVPEREPPSPPSRAGAVPSPPWKERTFTMISSWGWSASSKT